MDRKEAADLLDNLIGMVEDSHGADYDTALRMAINALTAQPDPDKLHLQKEQAYMQGWEDARLIDRQAAIDALKEEEYPCENDYDEGYMAALDKAVWIVEKWLPSAQPERLADDDFETIRIHLNAYKEKLCNQQRWKEAEEYQRIIDRFIAFASAQPERKTGKWDDIGGIIRYGCPFCHHAYESMYNYCPNCGARLVQEGEDNG